MKSYRHCTYCILVLMRLSRVANMLGILRGLVPSFMVHIYSYIYLSHNVIHYDYVPYAVEGLGDE